MWADFWRLWFKFVIDTFIDTCFVQQKILLASFSALLAGLAVSEHLIKVLVCSQPF